MAHETERSAEELRALAASDPAGWVRLFAERGGVELTRVNELGNLDAMEGLELVEVSSEGGCEGGGEHAEVTFAIAPEGTRASKGRAEGALAYVEFYGYYASEYGTEWDAEVHVVEPRDVTVVKYFKV